MTATAEPEIGKARRRKEDEHLITGRTRWTDNLVLPGMQHLAILRSPFAHARITGIDTTAARSMPGVVAVFTGADLAAEQGSLPCAWPITEDMKAPPAPSLAVDTVNFAGEAVAVVVARSAYEAHDALEAIDIDYDELPMVLDLAGAVADGADLVHPDLGTNVSAVWTFDSAEAGTGGDVEQAIRDAEVVIQRTFRQQRLIPAFMEPRSVVVDPTGPQLTVWSATQIPHILRLMFAMTLEIPEHKLRVIAPDVGGGFGGKLQVTPEEVIALAGRATARQAGQVHRVAQRIHARGTPRPRSDPEADAGRPPRRHRHRPQGGAARRHGRLSAAGHPGHTDPRRVHVQRHLQVRFVSLHLHQRLHQQGAHRRLPRRRTPGGDVRRRTDDGRTCRRTVAGIRSSCGRRTGSPTRSSPFDTVAGLTYDSGNYEAATAQARELFDYDGLRREQAERRERRDPVQLGIGVSTFTEMCGLAPSRMLGALGYGAGGWEHAAIRMLPTGKVEVVTGSSAHGQGHETAWSQIVADQLGRPVRRRRGAARRHPDLARGMDTYGSRSLAVGGIAVVKAAEKVIAKAKPIAAHLMECAEDDIEFTAGRFRVKGTEKAVGLADVALAVFAAHDLPEGVEPNLDSEATYDPENFSFPHGTHLCADGGRHRNRAGADSLLRVRRRHRARGQPA